MKILVTGGAGFIGSNFIIYMLSKYPEYKIINFDCLTYAGSPSNIGNYAVNKNYTFINGDITKDSDIKKIPLDVDMIVNFAAESHVDNSISNPEVFLTTNIIGTHKLLEFAKMNNIKKFLQVSTDEVYGSIEEGLFTEQSQIKPNSPYSASKASADHLVHAYFETWGLNVNITRCSNNYGPRQHAEKLIPKTIEKAIKNELIPVYGTGENIRDWLYVDDHCSAIDAVLHKGVSGAVYNIGGNTERTNIEVVKKILHILGKSDSLITFVDDRLGHDRRYAIDSTKIKNELGWTPTKNFDDALKDTISWYMGRLLK